MDKQIEQWKSIPGFLGYEASDQGRVRSYYKRRSGAIPPVWDIVDIPQRILKPTIRSGYNAINLRRDGKTHFRNIPRLVLHAFIGPPPEGMEVCHNDGNPHNDKLNNLRWDTHHANMNESRQNVDPEVIREMREKRATGVRIADLAREYGYSTLHMGRICRGKLYKEMGGPIITRISLNADAVRAIRQRRQDGITYRQIGEEFGISESGAWRICKGERYAGVD